MLSETRLDNEPVTQFEFHADIWSGTRGEVQLPNAIRRFEPHQQVEITNVVDRYPSWVMRLIRWFQPGTRPGRVVYRLPMRVEYVTGNRIGLIDEATYLVRNREVT